MEKTRSFILMEYLSWFAKDENRTALLEKLIRQQKPDVDEVEPDIRLICVVSDIDDQIRNAIYAITNHVKVYSLRHKPVMILVGWGVVIPSDKSQNGGFL